ncbi:MAG: glycosyltransferase [Candidatus Hydrogenedentes bacterium]|nr:glycosyltransferase [Candidatus Hydrogenedentota bacterium]
MNPANLRVAFVVDAIRGRNGVGTYYQDLAAQLDRRIGRAELISPCMVEPPRYQGWSMPLPGDATQRLYFPRPRMLSKYLGALQPHVVVVPVPGPFGIFGFWSARRMRAPLCVTCQTDYEKLVELYWHPMLARLSRGILRQAHRKIFEAADAVVAISRHMQDCARLQGVRDTRLVATPIAPVFLDTPLLQRPAQLKDVLFVGRLAAEKNLAAVFEAAAALPELHFRIAGDGPQREAVIQAAAALPNLSYLGWLSRGKVVEALDDSDALILPSTVEAFGTVAAEAMARQRLVLTSEQCGINEWPDLARGLYTFSAEEGLAGGLRRIVALSPEERLACAARGHAAAHVLNESALSQWIRLLVELASRGPALPGADRQLPAAANLWR